MACFGTHCATHHLSSVLDIDEEFIVVSMEEWV